MIAIADPRFDQDHVHDYLRGFRAVLDEYPGDRMAVGEAWVPDPARLARYVRPDELNLVFNFELVEADWGADSYRAAITRSLDALAAVAAPATWVLANHDVDRTATRYATGATPAAGLARARAAALVQLALPGAAYIYNGDELGLTNADLPDSALRDPTWERSGHTDRGRDGERVPLPWSGSAPPYGFGGLPTWLPQPDDWAELTVQAQDGEPGSTLNLYRRALQLRREFTAAAFELALPGRAGLLAFTRGALTVVLNTGAQPVPLPVGDVLLASGPVADGCLPPDTAAWIRG
jgi:alpha-glucosidase